MKYENVNIKKDIVKAILFVLLFLVIGAITITLTDNKFILVLSGILIEILSKIFDKWIDMNKEEK